MRFSGGANTATISQLRTNSATRIVMKRLGLQGIIGCFFGAPLTRRFPRWGSGGGGAVRGSGARASSAMPPLYVGRARNLPNIVTGDEAAAATPLRPGGDQGARPRSRPA